VTIHWTERAQDDLAAIHAFIETDSIHYAAVTVRRLLGAVDRLQDFPHSGRAVPEFNEPEVREVVMRPYRIVYRIVSATEIHVLTVHHGSRENLGSV
jgi:plasmid stabilization system protein ParE